MRTISAWITMLVQRGRIKAIKPLGGWWKIPKSEYERLTREGLPPLPREKHKAPPIQIKVSEDKIDKVAPPPAVEAKARAKSKPWIPLGFRQFFTTEEE